MGSGSKQYALFISPAAAEMLVSHARFLAQASEAAALRLVEEFDEGAESLEEFPGRNPWLDDPLIPGRRHRKLIVAKRYLLIYQVKGDTVYVDALVDCRQDYRWLL